MLFQHWTDLINYPMTRSPLGLGWLQKDNLEVVATEDPWAIISSLQGRAMRLRGSDMQGAMGRQKGKRRRRPHGFPQWRSGKRHLWVDVAPRPCFPLTTLKTFLFTYEALSSLPMSSSCLDTMESQANSGSNMIIHSNTHNKMLRHWLNSKF